MPIWPHQWQRLRDAGRLQFSFLTKSQLWAATVPELGVQVKCRSARALVEDLQPHLSRLPQPVEQQRLNN